MSISPEQAPPATLSHLLRALGVVLVLGGLGHVAGVTRFYYTHGLPGVDRVLLDIWVGEAQILGGALYMASFRAMRAGSRWRSLAVAGALTMLTYAIPFIPVLVARAPVGFQIPPVVYATLSLFILVKSRTAPN
jgi:uncharacterized membrane protein HdeD (DUF308 family)